MVTYDLTSEEIEQFRPKLKLVQHIGAVFWWFQTTHVYVGEPQKLKPIVISTTIKNLIFGWWSPLSIVINPVVSVSNWVGFVTYSKKHDTFLHNPKAYLYVEKRKFIEAPAKTDKRLKYALITLAAIIVIFVFLILIANN